MYRPTKTLMGNFLLAVITMIVLALTAVAQEAPKFIGGGVTLGMTNTQTTAAGGFVAGNYPFLKILEFSGTMSVENQPRFFGAGTTITFVPEMRMFVPVAKNTEFFFGGGMDGQVVTDVNPNAVNPIATFGLRFAKKYTVRGTYLFSDLQNNGTGDTFRGIRFGADIFHPLGDRLALIAGFDFDRQTFPFVPANQFKTRIGIAIK